MSLMARAPSEATVRIEGPRARALGGRRALLALVWAGVGVLLGTASCSSNNQPPTTCQRDMDCSDTQACVNGMCLLRTTGRQVAVTITPPTSSISAPTEVGQVMLEGQASIELTADDKQTLVGTVMSESTLFAREAHVAVGVPSSIPGLPDLQIQTEMANNMFTFALASRRVGVDTVASFRFTPGATAQFWPPVTLRQSLSPPIELTFPAKTALLAVNGRFLDATGAPILGGTIARLSSSTGLSSNAVLTDAATGAFRLLVQDDGTATKTDDQVTLTIGTLDDPQNVPQLVSGPMSLAALAQATQTTPRDFALPAFLPAMPATLHVTADGKDQSGVTVLFRTEIDAPPYGRAVYQRSVDTNAYGLAQVDLIPGPQGAPIPYQIAIQGRSSDYRYASRCMSNIPVAFDDSGTAVAALPVMELSKKLQLSGSVRDKTDAPVMGVRVAATQIAPSTTCTGIDIQGSNVVSLPTDGLGNYMVLVDPGTYRIDVTPPADSQWPRKTEDGDEAVTVSHDKVHPIVLPGGELTKGVVIASDRTLLPKSTVTIYAIFCLSQPCAGSPPPVVLAQTVTNDAGEFQAVIPAP